MVFSCWNPTFSFTRVMVRRVWLLLVMNMEVKHVWNIMSQNLQERTQKNHEKRKLEYTWALDSNSKLVTKEERESELYGYLLAVAVASILGLFVGSRCRVLPTVICWQSLSRLSYGYLLAVTVASFLQLPVGNHCRVIPTVICWQSLSRHSYSYLLAVTVASFLRLSVGSRCRVISMVICRQSLSRQS